MLLGLFNEMRAAKVPVSVRELLDLINALKHHVVFADMDGADAIRALSHPPSRSEPTHTPPPYDDVACR